MTAKSSPSADSADEIYKLLEHAALKYFPRPIEDVDTFLFAPEDDSDVDDPDLRAGQMHRPKPRFLRSQARPSLRLDE